MNKFRPVFYGLSELGPAGIDIFLKVYLLIYFNQVVGLSASYTSLAIGLSVLWDAIMDPLIGIFSDRYYQKYHHRKNILYFALVLICTLFFSMWRFKSDNEWISLIYLFFFSSFLNSAISLFSVPYYAIANDLEPDNEIRKRWIGWRLAFFNLGSLLGLIVPAYFLTQKNSITNPYLNAVSVLTIVTLFFTSISVFMSYYRIDKVTFKSDENRQRPRFLDLLKDKKFLQIILAFFVVNCGLGLNSALALYYYKLYLEFTEQQTQTILVVFLFMFTLSIPLWIYLTRYFSKKKLIMSGAALLGLITVAFFPHFKNVNFWIIFSVASLLGGILVGVAVVLEIFLSDFLKEKEELLKRSVAGQYLGLWKMASKVSRAVAIALAGPIIEISSGNTQILANYFGWGVGLFFVLSAVVMSVSVSEKS